jgi:hypothetical protein
MKKIGLGQTITILANVGVIAGIVFLAVEIRQNNRIVQAQTRAQIASESADHLMRRAENGELADIASRAENGDVLSPADERRLFNLFQSRFRRWENIHFQYRRGLYSEEEFTGNLKAWGGALSNQAAQRHWEQQRDSFSPEFRQDIDELIEQ